MEGKAVQRGELELPHGMQSVTLALLLHQTVQVCQGLRQVRTMVHLPCTAPLVVDTPLHLLRDTSLLLHSQHQQVGQDSQTCIVDTPMLTPFLIAHYLLQRRLDVIGTMARRFICAAAVGNAERWPTYSSQMTCVAVVQLCVAVACGVSTWQCRPCRLQGLQWCLWQWH